MTGAVLGEDAEVPLLVETKPGGSRAAAAVEPATVVVVTGFVEVVWLSPPIKATPGKTMATSWAAPS